jgi:hypothetical protein
LCLPRVWVVRSHAAKGTMNAFHRILLSKSYELAKLRSEHQHRRTSDGCCVKAFASPPFKELLKRQKSPKKQNNPGKGVDSWRIT